MTPLYTPRYFRMNQIVIGSQAASERPFYWNPCASGHDGLPEIRGGSSHSLPCRPVRVAIVLSMVFPRANWTKFKASTVSLES